MSSIPCNIVLIPDSDIAEKITSLSERLKEKGTYFTLKEGEYYPHASLYMVQLALDRLDEIKERLTVIGDSTLQVSLQPKEYHQESGYIGVEYQRDEIIDNLQMEIINAINPIRDGLREKDKERLDSAVGQERENIEKYGYRSVGKLFAPHITITRFKNKLPVDVSSLPDISALDAKFSKIGIFEMGENGTCIRKIAEFELSQ